MIAVGGTSFWEVFSPELSAVMNATDPPPNQQNGYTSMCHPWAAGPTRWLTDNVLGITPISPGFSSYSWAPFINSRIGITHVGGSIVTKLFGEIAAQFKLSEDYITGFATINSPKGTLCNFKIPNNNNIIHSIKINNNIVLKHNKIYSVKEIGKTIIDNDIISLQNLIPGYHYITVKYILSNEKLPYLPIPIASGYPAVYIGRDYTTQGNWNKNYGTDGYILFSYNGNGIDLAKLPTYVAHYNRYPITQPGGANSAQFSASTTDVRALVNPSNQNSRSIGALLTQNPSACYQTYPVDIILATPQWFKFTLYFVDWLGQNISQMIQIFDANTHDIIVPYQRVDNFYNGVYLSYAYNCSTRFRVNFIRGGDALVSAIFFDPYSP